MKIGQGLVTGMVAAIFVTVNPGVSAVVSAPLPNTTDVPIQFVITVRSALKGSSPPSLVGGDLAVQQGNTPAAVIGLQRLAGSLADMQLFILLDDSTRSSSLGPQLPELKTFLASLPATTQVAVGYMQNGTFALAQAFTADHQKAAGALRLPLALPGENGSPYFALSDLAKHWPSRQSTDRRAVLMLTDGVDRYYGTLVPDDPYVNAAIHDTLKKGVMVYSIYLRGAGLYGRGDRETTVAQSRLIDVSEETGGYAYFMGFSDPVTISPFLNDFKDRLANQYQVTIAALSKKGVQSVKLRTEMPGVKVQGPTHIYVP